jgi:hypothetical protein
MLLNCSPQLNGDKKHMPSFDFLASMPQLRSLSWHNGQQDGSLSSPFFHAIAHLKYLTRLYVETPMSLENDDSGLQAIASVLERFTCN